MKTKLFMALTVVLIGASLNVQGETVSQLEIECKHMYDFGAWFCLGYINGLLEGYTLSNPQAICTPNEGLNRDQVRRIVLRYIELHPEALPRDAGEVAIEAMRIAFPCKK